jgi:DNA polymerase-3 subunit alpha
MGIAVEPPNVNISGWDFTIEDRPPSPAIRFGLGAVKNVGQGAVETILQARQQMGIFTSINDFAHRVDLRQVGKRTLESLVKVGALDAFGSRPALLESLDRILSVSGAHFRASEKGQISMFGAHTGVVEEITLPKVAVEVTRREQLDWERELIGLYVSDHPLNPVMDTLNEIVTHFSGQLSEAGPNERVRVAGLITRIRPHQTKAGKAMGFVTIEDVQGAIELILFPNTWEKYSSLVDFDKIILAEGRPDAERGEAKVLVDRISTELKVMSAVGEPPSQVKEMAAPYKPGRLTAKPVKTPPKPKPAPAGDTTHPSARRVAETSPSIPEPPPPNGKDTRVPPASAPPKVVQKGKPIPPPPDSFPPDWSLASAIMDAVAEPDLAIASARAIVEPEQPPVDFPLDVEEPPPYPLPALESSIEKNAYPPSEIAPALEGKAELSKPRTETPGALTPVLANLPIVTSYIVPPAETAEGETVYMVTLILRPTADAVRDQVRIRQIYGTLIAYPGKDRFAFQVFENGRGFLIEFPNFTTHVCPEMLNRLKAFIAPENVRVEPITFQ